jgi:uncharacterized protein YutD
MITITDLSTPAQSLAHRQLFLHPRTTMGVREAHRHLVSVSITGTYIHRPPQLRPSHRTSIKTAVLHTRVARMPPLISTFCHPCCAHCIHMHLQKPEQIIIMPTDPIKGPFYHRPTYRYIVHYPTFDDLRQNTLHNLQQETQKISMLQVMCQTYC